MMTARALLDREPNPTEHEIREAISGQICRCTGYATIVRSVQWAAAHEAADAAGSDTDAAGSVASDSLDAGTVDIEAATADPVTAGSAS